MKVAKSIIPALFISLLLSIVFYFSSPIDGLYGSLNSSCNVFSKVGDSTHLGTGNFINNRSHPYVITCKHVAGNSDANLIGVIENDNIPKTCLGKLVISSKSLDYSIIQINGLLPNAKIVTFGKDNFRMGERIHYFGLIARPGKPFLHYGYLSQRDVLAQDGCMYNSANMTVINGSSGSVVYNESMEGVGIVCIHLSDSQMAYLSIDLIRKSLFDSGIRDLYGILDGECNVSLADKYKKVIETP